MEVAMIYRKISIPKQKTIALVAHDHRKEDLLHWVCQYQDQLKRHKLLGTGNTSRLISQRTGLCVQSLISGPLGGDQQLGAKIAQNEIDLLIFFWDPLESLPHDPDVKALLRIATLYNIAIASSPTTASYLLTSSLLNSSYEVKIVDNRLD